MNPGDILSVKLKCEHETILTTPIIIKGDAHRWDPEISHKVFRHQIVFVVSTILTFFEDAEKTRANVSYLISPDGCGWDYNEYYEKIS